MPTVATSESSNTQAQPPSKVGLHGAFWTHVMLSILSWMPRWLCVRLLTPVVFVIYLLAGKQRRAVVANLNALNPEPGPCINCWRGFRVFEQFALTYLDRLWHLHFGHGLQWHLEGDEHFQKLRSEQGGALVFTVHAGNYDIGSALFASALERALHIVRTPEQTASLQRMRSMELANQEQQHPNLHVHYNECGSHLGLELCKLLIGGELVAIQGDRVVMDVSPIDVLHEGCMFKLPRGPLVLAEMTRVPCYTVFLTRTGVLSYRVAIGPAFIQRGEKLDLHAVSQRWIEVMHRFIAAQSTQWFVFENLVRRESA